MFYDVITLFPEMFSGILNTSMVGRAMESGKVNTRFTNPREFTTDRHRSVDDRPYGGGAGMVLQPGPVFQAAEHVEKFAVAPPERTRKILLSPQGKRLEQKDLRDFAEAEWIILLCGHYEGFDERIRKGLNFEEFSIGDYVLTGGEIPAMVIIDGVTRLLPGVLGNDDSPLEESFSEEGLLEFPQYTRPQAFRGMKVPEVLLSGNHEKIAGWRKEEALRKTKDQRADLLERNKDGAAES